MAVIGDKSKIFKFLSHREFINNSKSIVFLLLIVFAVNNNEHRYRGRFSYSFSFAKILGMVSIRKLSYFRSAGLIRRRSLREHRSMCARIWLLFFKLSRKCLSFGPQSRCARIFW